jgi:hypothetical protein
MQLLPSHLHLELILQPLSEMIHQCIILHPTCPLCVPQVAICKIFDGLRWLLAAAFKLCNRGLSCLTEATFQLLLEVSPVGEAPLS